MPISLSTVPHTNISKFYLDYTQRDGLVHHFINVVAKWVQLVENRQVLHLVLPHHYLKYIRSDERIFEEFINISFLYYKYQILNTKSNFSHITKLLLG